MSMVFVVINGAEIDSAWTTEHEAQSQAATLNAAGGVALTWSVVGTRLGGPLERLRDDGKGPLDQATSTEGAQI